MTLRASSYRLSRWIGTASLFICALCSVVSPAHSADEKTSETFGLDVARIDGKATSIDGNAPLSIPATARNLTFGFTPEAGHRMRFRLEGVDSAWREGAGFMALRIRFADANGEQVAVSEFRIAGESAGWSFDLQKPVFVKRHETIIAPPRATAFWIEISSAGPPETLGVALISELAVSRVGANDSTEILLSGPRGRRVDARFPGAPAPDGFISDGTRPNMARLLTVTPLHSVTPLDCLAIIDEDSGTHAEWHTIKQDSPRIAPGEILAISWNEAYSVGYGYRVEESYPLPPAGVYRFRLQSLDLLGHPVGAEYSRQIRVLSPWWQRPWVWVVSFVMLAGCVFALARHLGQRRIREQLAHVKEERLIEQERLRIAREIHDTLAQGFTGVIIQLEAAEDARSRGLCSEADRHLARALDLSRESLQEARRSVMALRPQALVRQDLCAALRELVEKMTAGTTLEARFRVEGRPPALPPTHEENLLRICQEVLTNTLRHASATRFDSTLTFTPEAVRLELRDDGRGFEQDASHEGFGLLGMKERMEQMNGELTIRSAPGEGTLVTVHLPCPAPARKSIS